MLREPKNVTKSAPVRKDQRTGRFQFIKLEERIAPACHTNPQGKEVGDCSKHGGGHHGFA